MRNREELVLRAEVCEVPDHLIAGLVEYIVAGRPVGQFLTAVLENDLMGAFSRADEESAAGMKKICTFLYSCAPGCCFGSRANVEAWYLEKDKQARANRK